MLRGYRGIFTKIAGLAILCLLSAFVYALTVPYSRSLQQEAANQAKIHRQHAEDRIEGVCLSPSAQPDCVEETRQTQRESERQEYDLAAQRMSAWWAQVMGVAALIGMGLSAVGVWLVKTTFDETRKGNEIARDHQRGRIVIEIESGYGADTGTLVIAIKGHNIGNSVALNCRMGIAESLNCPESLYRGDFGDAPHTIGIEATATLATYSSIGGSVVGRYVYGTLTYECIFGETHQSHFCYKLMPLRNIPNVSTKNVVQAINSKPIHWPADT
jgi:hypothetical protein